MSDELQFLSKPEVRLIDHMGTDASVTRAARVSVLGLNEQQQAEAKEAGLINYLMKARHGSPFEHATMTFYVKGPIFSFREFMRHRMASYNERSGRYSVLEGNFYVPDVKRPLVNVGSSARPEFGPATRDVYDLMVEQVTDAYTIAWAAYQTMLAAGIANEVARIVLPVGIFSEMYVTMNLRALMNFLSLRVDSPDAAVRTRPQFEIQQEAELMEAEFALHYPLVHAAFLKNGRVAP